MCLKLQYRSLWGLVLKLLILFDFSIILHIIHTVQAIYITLKQTTGKGKYTGYEYLNANKLFSVDTVQVNMHPLRSSYMNNNNIWPPYKHFLLDWLFIVMEVKNNALVAASEKAEGLLVDRTRRQRIIKIKNYERKSEDWRGRLTKNSRSF